LQVWPSEKWQDQCRFDVDLMNSMSNRHQFDVDSIIISHWERDTNVTCTGNTNECSNARSGVDPMTRPQMPEEYILPEIVIDSLRWRIIPAHCQQPRQQLDEHASDPRLHYMGLRRTVMHIYDHHCYPYAVKHERKLLKCKTIRDRVNYSIISNCINF